MHHLYIVLNAVEVKSLGFLVRVGVRYHCIMVNLKIGEKKVISVSIR